MIDHIAIIAGGRGTRLVQQYPDTPKALIPIGGKPLIQHQLEWARNFGVRNVTIFAGYLAGKIRSFVGDGSRFQLRVEVVIEEKPLGSAGQLLRSLDQLPDQFFVVYGDVMCAVDLSALAAQHREENAEFTAMVHPNDHPFDSDLLEVDDEGWITAIHTAPHEEGRIYDNLVNAALYAVNKESLIPLPPVSGQVDFVADIMRNMVNAGQRVLAFRTHQYLKDMGTPERLRKVENDLSSGRIDWAGSRHQTWPAVFLDRDGTLNAECGHLSDPDDLQLLAGVAEGLRKLRHAGLLLIVVSNQPVVARGEASLDVVLNINRKLQWELGKKGAYLDAVYICPHHPQSGFPGEVPELKTNCDCRKPGTGMFQKAASDFPIDVGSSWMIGDQGRDVGFARGAGLRSILLGTGLSGSDDEAGKFVPDFRANSFTEAAELILSHRERAA